MVDTSWDEGPPGAVRVGSLLVSLLEPEPGDEVGFHRWYERDHFYAGCLAGPWFFAGRRYVARPQDLASRYPDLSPLVANVREGSHLALYWIEAGHHDEAERWAVQSERALARQHRTRPCRASHAGFYDVGWSWSRDDDGVPVELALDHPYPGLAVVAVDCADGVQPDELHRWYREQLLPAEWGASRVASCLAATPRPLPDGAPGYVPRPPGLARRTLLLCFLEDEPHALWPALFSQHGKTVAASGLGSVVFASPFVPTIPGTDVRVGRPRREGSELE